MKIMFLNIKSFFLKLKIKQIFDLVLKEVGLDEKNLCVNVGYVSNNAIQTLNKKHRGIDKITDVLSFPLVELKPGEKISDEIFQKEKTPLTNLLELGDIVICESVAKEQAEKNGHSLKREVCFLSLHGFLHVLGFDHENDEEEKNMNKLCEKILEKVGIKISLNNC